MKKSGTDPGHPNFSVGLPGHLPATILSLFLAVFVLTGQAWASGGAALDSYPYQHALINQQLAKAVAVDPAGYMIIVGYTQNATQDFMVVKVKADGSGKLWEAVFDLNNNDDQAVAVAVGASGNVFVTGSADNGVNTDIHTVKYNGADGAVLWENTYNGPNNGNDMPFALAMDYLNNVYVAGKTQGDSGDDDGLLIKYGPNGANPDGSPIFEVIFNGAAGNGNDEFVSVGVGPSGVDGVVVTGKTSNGTDFDYVSMKYNFDGTKVCAAEKIYDSGAGNDRGKYAAMDGSGHMIVTGRTGVNGGDIRTIKYDGSDCSQSWSRDYSSTAGSTWPDEPQGIWVDNTNDVYITGNTYSSLGFTDFYTARYSGSDGTPTWEKVFSSAAVGNTDIPTGIVVDNDGDVFVTGYSHKDDADDDFTTLKYKKDDGTPLWDFGSGAGVFDGVKADNDQAVGLGLDNDGKLYVGGWSDAVDTYTSVVSDYDFLVIKYDPGNLNPPSSLVATTVSDTGIDLIWDDNSANETGFKIYWALSATLDYTEVATVSADVKSYSDTGLNTHIWYSYKVKAYISSPASESHFTAPATALTTMISYTAPAWTYTYTSSDAGDDEAFAIDTGPDQHPVVVGSTQTAANGILVSYDYHTVKLDRSNAAKLWDACYNDIDDETDEANCIAVDDNNDVVVSGYSNLSWLGNPNTDDIYTRKYLSTGPNDGPPNYGDPYVWSDQYNGPAGNVDRSEAIDSSIDGDNNVVVTGHGKNASLDEDIYVIKYDTANGDRLWAYTPYDGGDDDEPVSVAFDGNGDVIVTGRTFLGGDYDIFTRKHSGADGAVLWTAIYDAGNGWDEARAMDIDSNGDVYIAGAIINGSGNDDWIIIKYDGDTETATGTVLWYTTVDGPAGGEDIPEAIKVDPNDDAVVVSGTILKSADNNDFHVRRYTSAGALDWENTLERPGNDDNATTMGMDISGNVCVAGNTDDGSHIDLMAVKYDSAGNILGGTLYDAADSSDAHAMAANRSGDIFVAGYTTPVNNGDMDFLVLKCEGYALQSPSPFTPTSHYSAVDFTWVVDNTSDEDGFYVDRKLGTCDSENSWVRIHTAPAGASGLTSYTDEGLNIGGTYCYRVQTYKNDGSTSRWIEKEVTTSTPPAPTDFSATVLNTTEIKLQWTDTTSSESGFTIQRCVGAGCTDFTSATAVELDVPANAEIFIDTTACYNQTYNYRIQAYKTGYWKTAFTNSSTTDLLTDNLADPTLLTLDGLTQDTLSLVWNDNSNDETSFTVERCPGAVGACTTDNDFTYSATVTTIYGNVLLYGMDAITADEVTDSSGNSNTGTVSGSPTVEADGKYYSRILFDGTNDFITSGLAVAQAAPATANAGATMMAWVYPSSTSANNHYLFSTENGSAGSENFNWGISRNGATWYVDTGEASRSTDVAVTAEEWQHIAAVFDPASGSVKFYKNGAETTVAFLDYHDTAQDFTIGRRGAINQEFFNGALDEVAVYDRSLTQAQVQYLMNNTVFEAGKAKFGDNTITYTDTYTYRVKAVKNTDPSCTWDPNPTNSLEVTADPPPPTDFLATGVDSTRVILDWTDNTLGEDNFTLERCIAASCTYTDVTTTIAADSQTYSDNSACGATTYNYRIKGTDAVWTATQPSTVSQTATGVEGIAPTGLAITDVWEEQAEFEWTYLATDLTGFKAGACPASLTPCSNPGDYSLTTAAALPSGIQAMWRFDEPDWKNDRPVEDSSGNGYHGTAQKGVNVVTPGKFGHGHGEFDGSSQYITTPLNINQSNSSARITLEAWVYPTVNTNVYKDIISTESYNNAYNWGISQYGATWRFWVGNTSITATVTWNDWNHLVVVYDPSESINKVKAYKNGVLASTRSSVYYNSTDANVTIGRRAYTNDRHFPGKIDEVVIYNRALSLEEIQDRAWNRTRHTISGLEPNTLYRFKVWPYKNADCAWDGPATLVDMATDNIAGLSPTSFTHSAKDTTLVTLSWNDIASSETAYHVQRCDNVAASCADGDYANIQGDGLVQADTTSYSDTSACNGITYTYRVRAEKDDGPVWNSEWAIYEMTTVAAQAPALTATVLSESEITLEWSDPNIDEDEFFLARCQGDAAACTTDNDFIDYTMTTAGSIYGTSSLHYRMDEEAWANGVEDVKDVSGNDRHGRPYGSVTTVDTTITDGPYDRAGDFLGGGDYIVSPLNIDQSSSTAGVTFEAWVKPTQNDTTYKYVFSTENGGYDWGFAVRSTSWYVNTGNTRWGAVGAIMDDWQHVAVVYEPGQAIKFYRNGTKYTASVASYPIYFDSSDNNINIGRQANSSGYFIGGIDEVAVYERALTDAEITAHYQNQIDKFEYADTGLTAGTDYTYRIKTLKDAPLSCAGGWEIYTDVTTTTMAPPAPTNLTATVFSTSIVLKWDDNSGSEDNYQVQRCDTAGCSGYTRIGGDLAFDAETYTDTTICPGNTYSYRVRAVKDNPGGWETLYDTVADNVVTAPSMPSNLTATLVSEVQIDLAWDDNTSDETFFRVRRCAGADCLEYTVAADTETYNDIALTPATSYTYAIQADQPAAACGWPTAYTEAAGPVTTTPNVPGDFSGAAVDSTSVDMTWAEDLASETGFTILRCAGAGCSDYTEVGLSDPGATSFTDDTACNGTEYSYKIKSVGRGLSNGNGSCWTKRAPLTFTNGFRTNTAVEVVVSYTSGMQTMFEDIRFYDATAKQELPTYWFRTRTDSGTAVVWLMTGDYDNIYLYYGNSDATDSSGTDAPFTEVYDDFDAAGIDSDKWVEIDATNKISQTGNGYLTFAAGDSQWTRAMISTKTFERAAGNEILWDLSTVNDSRRYIVFGWEKNQTASTATSQVAHGIYFYGRYEYNSRFYILENGSGQWPSPTIYYEENKNYQLKTVLKANGATHYIKGGLYPDWTTIRSTTGNSDPVLRLGILHYYLSMKVDSVTVKHASAQRGVVIGAHEGNEVACLGGYNLWASAESDAFTTTTADNTTTPTDFTAVVVSDTEVLLSWTDETDDETGFKVERCLNATCLVFNAGAGTSYLDDGLIPAETYDYRIKAYKLTDDCEWNSLYSSPTISVTTSSGAPSDLTATTLNSFKIELNWTDNSADEDGFEIEAQAWNGVYANIGTVDSDITTFTDNRGTDPGSTHKYRVRAYRNNDKSAYSNVITIDTAAYQADDSNCIE